MNGGERPPVDLIFLWHHHQPDYRSPRDGRAVLPWVRLHATKDYLDMALRLGRHPGVRSTFNFVPSLLDQLDAAAAGGPDALFDLLRRPVAELSAAERDLVTHRCTAAPRHALEKWPAYRQLCERVWRGRGGNGAPALAANREVVALEVWFLLAWLDPMFHDTREARAALARAGDFGVEERDTLLGLHDRLLREVIPAYAGLAAAGQIELSESAYYHPILPLLVDVQSARRACPEIALPTEPFSAPADAMRHIERALERHAQAFGSRPQGVWPPEGSVSPEVAELAARAGVRWLATDEGVLWNSLPLEARKREALYRPWGFQTPGGEVVLFFRDRELSDRIGFVYHHWLAEEAVADLLERIRKIAREHGGPERTVISIILDGENCWEYYPDDGGPFLEALYTALESAPDIRTCTPSQVIAEAATLEPLARLHSGSWVNSDFRIWIGHPEKNRAWDLLSRARRALVEHRVTPEGTPAAWEALFAAEGSDWFWWFGDDHYTADKAVFDQLFRDHLQATYERASLPVPGWLQVPIVRPQQRREREFQPLGFIRPTLDGRRTGFYEWHAAGRHRLDVGGSAMHRGAGIARDLYFGFDPEHFYLRVDFAAGRPPGSEFDLVLEILTPRQSRVRVRGLQEGERPVCWDEGAQLGQDLAGAQCSIGNIVEIGIPFASLGLLVGDSVEVLGTLLKAGEPAETLPTDDLIRFSVPDHTFEAAMWSA